MNRKQYLLNTIEEARTFIAQMEATPENKHYLNRVYGLLIDAQPGTRIEIDKIVAPANLRKFIGCVCVYIWDTDRALFDQEYRIITKY
jgi:hypothetical protein